MHRLRQVPLLLALLLLASPAAAQDAVPALKDLVGARAAGAESDMTARGYEFLRTDEAGDAKYGYWREKSTGKCVTVRTAEGRYESIVYAPAADCGAPAPTPAAADDGMRDIKCKFAGKEQRCKVAISQSQAGTSVDVHFPDGFVRSLVYDHGSFRSNDGMTYKTEHHDGKWILANDNREKFWIPKKWLE
jgi:hypothetical protein